jgi:hypothetical protein
VTNRGENSDLVQSVFFFFWVQVSHFDPLESVDVVVLCPEYFVDCRVGPVTQFAQDLEIFERHSEVVSRL